MALSDYVSITITRATSGITAPGFGTPLVLGYGAVWSDRVRFYTGLPGMVTDGFTVDSPEYLAANAIFSQTPSVQQVAIGRGTLKPTQKFVIGVNSAGVGSTYQVAVAGKGVTATNVVYTPTADITSTLLPRVTNVLTLTAHGMVTGDGPYYVSTSSGLPGGLTVNTPYWIINVTANTFSFASTKANAIALTPVTLSSDGAGNQTIVHSSNDVIMAQLLQQLNAVVGLNYLAVQSGSAGSQILTVTATAAGNWFSLGINDASLLSNAQTHVDPGVATDLNAIIASQPNWYGLVTVFNSQAYVTGAANWTQGNVRIYTPEVQDTLALTTVGGVGGSADTIDALHTLSLSRVMVSYHPIPAQCMGAAWMGVMLPQNPGSATWKFKTLIGVSFLTFTPTQKTNLRSRQGNSCENVSGLSVTFEGTCGDAEFMDAIVGDDWVAANMQVAIFNVLVGSLKIAFEDSGVAQIQAAIIQILKQAVARKIYAVSPAFTVTVPAISSLSTANKGTRTIPNITWTATRSGAVHVVNVQGTISL